MFRIPSIAGALFARPSTRRWLAVSLVLLPQLGAADPRSAGFDAYIGGDFNNAYRLLAPLATADEPELQNLVALMVFNGRGTEADPAAAHDMFHDAAMNGSVDARRNLGILHTTGAPGIEVSFDEAGIWFATSLADASDQEADRAAIPDQIKTTIEPDLDANENGKRVYLTFCSGCHGFNGMRFFRYAPSFALGQRLTKSDAELMDVILRGKGQMPSWEDKLPLDELEDALAYLRVLAIRTAFGLDLGEYQEQPDVYFIFYPGQVRDGDIINPHDAGEDL